MVAALLLSFHHIFTLFTVHHLTSITPIFQIKSLGTFQLAVSNLPGRSQGGSRRLPGSVADRAMFHSADTNQWHTVFPHTTSLSEHVSSRHALFSVKLDRQRTKS